MRVALIVPGGVDRSATYRVIPVLLALIERLARHHELEVFALAQGGQPDDWPLLGAQVHNVGQPRTLARTFGALRRQHRQRPFDVVHAVWSGWGGAVAVAAARTLGVPSLVHVAGGELVALADIGYGGRRSALGRLREAVVLRAASRVSAASAPMIDALARLGIRAVRVPLGIDLRAWGPGAAPGRAPGEPARLIQVASLNRVKDQTTLLHALAGLRAAGVAFHMDLVGEDTLAGEIQSLARRLGLEQHLTFHGFLTQAQLRPLLGAAHLLVVSSRHEAGPVALLEAAALGVPAVGTAVGHLAEWSPEAACVVPVADAPALAAAAAAVLGNEARRLALAREAARRVRGADADRTAELFEALYASVCRAGLRKSRNRNRQVRP